jgi:hypothetical protein
MIARIDANLDEFSSRGDYAEAGRLAYKAMIVPPIALGLSLFFSLVNAGAFFTGLADLGAKLVARTLGNDDHDIPGAVFAGIYTLVLCVLMGGSALVGNRLSNNAVVQELLASTRQESAAATRIHSTVLHASRWVISAEPAVYRMARRTGLYEKKWRLEWVSSVSRSLPFQ